MHNTFYQPLTILRTRGRWLLSCAKAVVALAGRGLGIWRLVAYGCRVYPNWKDCPCVGPDGKEFWLDLRGKGFSQITTGWCVSEIEPTLHSLDPDAVILDIGANIGTWARLFSAHVPRGRVYAFEPSAATFKRLERNQSVARNITCIKAAVGEKSGHVGFSDDECDSVLRHIKPGLSAGKTAVAVWNLADWVAAENIQRIDLIKVDVEGFEAEVLVPSAEVIRRFCPIVVFEYFADFVATRSRFSTETIFETFRALHYSVYRLDKNGTAHPDHSANQDWTNDYVAYPNGFLPQSEADNIGIK